MRPPPYPVRLARSGPLSNRLQAVVAIMGGHPFIATRWGTFPLAREGAAAVDGIRGALTGPGAYFSATTDKYRLEGLPPLHATTDGISWFGWAYAGAANSSSKIALQFVASGGSVATVSFGNSTDTAAVVYCRSGGTFPQRASAVAPYVASRPYFIAGERSTAVSYPNLYLDGVLSNGAGYSANTSNLDFAASGVILHNSATALNGAVFMAGLFSKVLGSAAQFHLARNPWQLLERADRPVIYSLPSGTGVTISASLTDSEDTVSASASLDISSSASITDAADSVSVALSADVVAQASITDDEDDVSAAISTGGSPSLDAALVDDEDSVSAAGTVSIDGSASLTDATDSLSSAVALSISVSAALNDAADTVSATATTGVDGGLTAAEIADAVWDELMVDTTSARTIMAGMADFLRSRGYLP